MESVLKSASALTFVCFFNIAHELIGKIENLPNIYFNKGTCVLLPPHSRIEVRLIIMEFTKIRWKYNRLVTKLWKLPQRMMEGGQPRLH